MGIKKIKVLLIVFCLFVLLIQPNVFAQKEGYILDISQVDVEMPQLKVYADVFDEDDTKLSEIKVENLSATLDGEKVEVTSVKSFSQLNEGVATVFLIDISKSISNTEFDNIKDNMIVWVNNMKPQDKVSIITFGEEVKVLRQYTSSKDTLISDIAELALTDNKTRFYDGVQKALTLSRVIDTKLPFKRVIVAITDGKDDFAGGVTKDEVIKNIESDLIPIYALGIFKDGLTTKKQESLDVLGEIARTSKGAYYQKESMFYEEIFNGIQKNIGETQVIYLDCGEKKSDGQIHQVYLALEDNGKKLETSYDVRLNNNMQDLTPPSVLEMLIKSEDSIALYFSEDVIGAENIDNYEILDADEQKVIPSEIEYTSTEENGYQAIVKFIVPFAGKYDVTVSGITDKADYPNLLENTTLSFDVKVDETTFYEQYKMYIFIGAGVLLFVLILVLIITIVKASKRRKEKQISPSIIYNDIPKTQALRSNKTMISKTTTPQAIKTSSIVLHFAVLDKSNQSSVFEKKISSRLVIGRASESDIKFDDTEMSRKHCEITFEDGKIFANDLHATNTTIVNGIPIKERIRLENGDSLLVGQTELKISWKE